MTLREDSPVAEGTELVLVVAVSNERSLRPGWGDTVVVTARPAAVFENSTFTVVAMADKAASRLDCDT